MLNRSHLYGWAVLVPGSAVLAAGLTALHLPAAVLLASMLLAIVFATTRDLGLRVPPLLGGFAQGLLGCLVARTLQPSVLHRVAFEWPLFLGITLLVLATSGLLGYWLARRNLLPGTTAVWGLAPGAASAMVIMADASGADGRLVALMQYLRVVLVTLLATLVAGFGTHHSLAYGFTHVAAPIDWWAWNSSAHIAATVGLVVAGLVFARTLRIAIGAMLIPLSAGLFLQGAGWLTIELPPPLLAGAYAVLGWSIGLRFSQPILAHAWRVLPHMLMAIGLMVLLGLLLAGTLVAVGHFEPLTAYLATSPGGADSVAVISASAAVDSGFVMAMQLARFAMVVLTGPRLFRWVAALAAEPGRG